MGSPAGATDRDHSGSIGNDVIMVPAHATGRGGKDKLSVYNPEGSHPRKVSSSIILFDESSIVSLRFRFNCFCIERLSRALALPRAPRGFVQLTAAEQTTRQHHHTEDVTDFFHHSHSPSWRPPPRTKCPTFHRPTMPSSLVPALWQRRSHTEYVQASPHVVISSFKLTRPTLGRHANRRRQNTHPSR